MPPRQLAENRRRFPVSPELCNLQAFCGDLYAGGHNEANFESPWYMFFSCALPKLLSTPPESESAPEPLSKTRYAVAPQYVFSLPRERATLDAQTEDKIRKKLNRIPDFAVWFIDGAPQHPSPRTLGKVETIEQAREYFKGAYTITKAALLLCVEVKNLPDIHVERVVADLPRSLEKAESRRLAEAQEELQNKLVVHFSSCTEGEEVVVLACAGSKFTWNVAVRSGSDVLPTEILSSEDDSSYLPKPARTKPAASGVINAAEEATSNVPNPPSDSQPPRTRAAIKGTAATSESSSEQANTAAQLPSEIRAATSRGKIKEAATAQKPSEHTAGSSEDGRTKGSRKEAKPTRKKPSEMKVVFKKKWSSSVNWNDEASASSKARLWEAIQQANPGIEFWN